MKRSEMIKQLDNLLIEGDLFSSRDLLRIIEEAGMKPPPYDSRDYYSESEKAAAQKYGKAPFLVYGWEPENNDNDDGPICGAV